jgi:galactokinase
VSTSGATAWHALGAAFVRLTGHQAAGVWQSPGRVNIIGEHTDYNQGLVLPAAIDVAVTLAAGLRVDGIVRCASLQVPAVVEVSLDEIRPGIAPGWPANVLGTAWALQGAGVPVPGIDIVVDSSLPIGGGLASSAAMAVAFSLAATELVGHDLSMLEIARACQRGEQAIAGAPTGLMDQVAVLAGAPGRAVFLDCRSLAHSLVPFAPTRSGAALLVIDTAVAHDNRARGYRERREQCDQAAEALGVDSLRDSDLDDVSRKLSGTLQRRARHVVSENGRVATVVELLRAGRIAETGRFLNESHVSLRDDFEVSCAELDCAVDCAQRAGAWGARLTGAGFGGSAIALVDRDAQHAVARAVTRGFADRGFAAPHVFAVTTAKGAGRVI